MPRPSGSAGQSAIRTYVNRRLIFVFVYDFHVPFTTRLSLAVFGTFKMKRNPRKLKWTKAFRKAAGKEMVVDSTLQFAARRNVPVRYNRDLVQKTLKAMERISEIRARRERVFYKRRMAGKRARELAEARRLVNTHSHLLPRLRGSEKRRLANLARERGEELNVEELQKLEQQEVIAQKSSANQVFGKEKQRLRVRVDGDVEAVGADAGGAAGEMDVDWESE
ncbi:hypothetical protein DL769_001427 [Monosporascus sp. CRB-8-3]|nr:hypothetical protein DL769_001427 [Monosporascus sp. CRB-8-3]